MKKKIGLLFALILVFALGGCTPDLTPPENVPPVVEQPAIDQEEPEIVVDTDKEVDTDLEVDKEVDKDIVDDEVVAPTPEAQSKEVTLYFGNNKYMETGDEALEQMFTETRVIEYSDVSLEEAMVRALMEGPKDTDTMGTLIPDTVKLISVEVKEGTALVNFEQEGMSGGSMQEMFTIDQIVNTLTELDSVERVQFLINGTVTESLMGHVLAEEPFERDME